LQQGPGDLQLRRERTAWRGSFTAMANPCEVLCETDDADAARAICATVAAEARRIEHKFSRYRDDSVVHAINTSRGRPMQLDAETVQLLEFGATLWQLSEGAFDLTSGVLRGAWRFERGASLPDQSAIDALLQRVGWQRVRWQPPELILPEGMEIDLGGIGKEYAVDNAIGRLAAWSSIPVLVNFGGDLRVNGPPPLERAWQVGIESTAHAGTASHRIQLSAGALATSGQTYKFIEVAGRRYGHIIDARTGWPTPDAPLTVTVAADTCSQAGVFTTLAMLQGARAEQFLEAEGLRFWCQWARNDAGLAVMPASTSMG
jgi:thiamine biosynthesis lipoprotein